jgi:hypothetical protein
MPDKLLGAMLKSKESKVSPGEQDRSPIILETFLTVRGDREGHNPLLLRRTHRGTRAECRIQREDVPHSGD